VYGISQRMECVGEVCGDAIRIWACFRISYIGVASNLFHDCPHVAGQRLCWEEACSWKESPLRMHIRL